MIEKQQKAFFFHSERHERSNGYEQVLSYQIVSLVVTES